MSVTDGHPYTTWLTLSSELCLLYMFNFMQTREEDFRVFFLNTYSGPARKIICYVGLHAWHHLHFTIIVLVRHTIMVMSILDMLGSCTTGIQMVGGLRKYLVLIMMLTVVTAT